MAYLVKSGNRQFSVNTGFSPWGENATNDARIQKQVHSPKRVRDQEFFKWWRRHPARHHLHPSVTRVSLGREGGRACRPCLLGGRPEALLRRARGGLSSRSGR